MPTAQILEDKQLLFKEQVLFKFKDTRIEIRYRDQGCAIAIPADNQQETLQLLRLLQLGSLSLDQLMQACPGIQDQIPELLNEFGQRGFLANIQDLSNVSGVTGRQFYRELFRFLKQLKQQFPPSPLSQQLASGTLLKNQLIGYALESYHVTHLCPRLLAPALAHYESITTQRLLQDFFVSELHHDHLLKKSLKSIGIESEQLQQMQPLPTTFTVCATLGVFARQHPLSFKSALMLFEEDDKIFLELFEQHCQTLTMPSDFHRPILLHSHINEEGAHDQITADLLVDIPYVSPEAQLLVKKNMTLLVEAMVLRTYEILDYYGKPDSVIPRCFIAAEEILGN